MKKIDRIIELLEQLVEQKKAKQSSMAEAALAIVRQAALACRERGFGFAKVASLAKQFEEKFGKFTVNDGP